MTSEQLVQRMHQQLHTIHDLIESRQPVPFRLLKEANATWTQLLYELEYWKVLELDLAKKRGLRYDQE